MHHSNLQQNDPMNNKKIYTILFIAIIGLIGLYYFNKYRVAPKIDIAKLEVADSTGKRFDIQSLKGQKVVVSFYASWCGDCIKELKEINSIKKEKLNDVIVLAITDESLEKMVSFSQKKQYPFTFLKLNKTFNDLKIYSIPTLYLLNTKGEVVYEHIGYVNWTDESTLSHLKALMQ